MREEEKEAKNKYNLMAEKYHNFRTKDNPQGWFFNELLEMPSTLKLLGNVKGKKILDFGCGSGIYAKLLTKRGAIVKGFDISSNMLKIAKKENPNLDLKIGSGYNIPFNEKFDIVIASLVLDYLKDWDKVFKQVSKVLKKEGFFIFSIGNPVSETVENIKYKGKKIGVLGINNYFKEEKSYSNWKFHNKNLNFKIPSYHKTYETIINTIIKNNFYIIGYIDTAPLKKAKKLFSKHYEVFSNAPYFCVWKVRRV